MSRPPGRRGGGGRGPKVRRGGGRGGKEKGCLVLALVGSGIVIASGAAEFVIAAVMR